MKRDLIFYTLFAVLFFAVIVLFCEQGEQRNMPLLRAIDTVNVGSAANDGTGDPLRTAFLKINKLIVMADSLDLELLTNDEVQALKDVEDLADGLLFPAGDTTVAAEVGLIVYQSADSTLYLCRSTVAAQKWYALN